VGNIAFVEWYPTSRLYDGLGLFKDMGKKKGQKMKWTKNLAAYNTELGEVYLFKGELYTANGWEPFPVWEPIRIIKGGDGFINDNIAEGFEFGPHDIHKFSGEFFGPVSFNKMLRPYYEDKPKAVKITRKDVYPDPPSWSQNRDHYRGD